MCRRQLVRAAISAIALLVTTGHFAHGEDPKNYRARTNRAGTNGGAGGQAPSGSLPGVESPYANALRIARMLHDDGVVAQLLTMQGTGRDATEADLVAVIEAREAAGTPALAVDFLRQRIKRYPDERRPRMLLAQLLVRAGRSRDAVALYKEQIDRFGFDALSLDETCRYARALARTG
ncbi:MAG TPA: hypothetical protein VM580_17690, partial [Labilithrix sp.]|nr:hypothetical protein [Labilithrix sp.]